MKSVQEMTNAILQSGLTEPELAKLAKTTQPTINRIKQGKTVDPGWRIGKAIEAIYLDLQSDNAA